MLTTSEKIQGEEEELADFTTHAANKYANEPDWTEMYQDDDDSDSIEEIIPTTVEVVVEDTHQRKIPTITQETHIAKPPSMTSQSSIKEEEEEAAEEIEEELQISPKITAAEAEKIPQIDEQVLHHLPLPQLSKEIPPTLIHKKASFEKSMYGEQPLMSISSTRPTNRISRFSMTEEDFLKLKKKEEEEKNMHKFITPSLDPVQETVTEENKVVDLPFVVADEASTKTDVKEHHQQEELVTQHERRSSIVATAAHSILGDKLDDFTEKLAFIKKNIIMSIDSDDDEDIEEADDAKTTLQKIAKMNSNENSAAL